LDPGSSSFYSNLSCLAKLEPGSIQALMLGQVAFSSHVSVAWP